MKENICKIIQGLKLCLKRLIRQPIKFNLSTKVSFNIVREAEYGFKHFNIICPDTIQEMRSFLMLSSGKNCLLDVGAHHGIFSLAFTCNNPKKIAYAIEPSPGAFEILKYHQRINPRHNIKISQIALGAHPGKLKMKYQWNQLMLISESPNNEEHIEVKATTLDDFVKENDIIPDIIKIDTEGSEFNILKGGIQFLKEQDPLIFLETHTTLLKIQEVSIDELVNLIFSIKYKIYDHALRQITDPVLFLKNRSISRIICSKKRSF